MAKVLVTGATGLLGCALVPLLKIRGHVVIQHGFRSNAEVNANLSSYSEVSAMLMQVQPDCIVNLAALTDVDACERSPNEAYLMNVAVVEHLCLWIREHKPECHLVQISTDQLYDGAGPHLEEAIKIVNCYAFSKIAAEIAGTRISSTILRTNFFGRSRCEGRSSFSDWIFQNLKQSAPLKVFDDILFSPLSINSLTAMIEQVIQKRPCGVYNLGSNDGMSKADFAYAFAEALGLPTVNLCRVLSTELTLKAYRPKDMRMNSARFEKEMGLSLPRLIDEINSMRSDYLELT